MTVCIAAICQDGDEDKIVLCTDKKLSSPLGSAETGNKILYLRHGWRLLTAGDQPDILALRRLYRLKLKASESCTAENIDESLKWPLRQRKMEISDEYTYSRYNLAYNEFLATGKAKLPDDEFRSAVREIRELGLNASLIIAGFIDKSAEVYWTDPYGSVKATADFAVVGEGEHLAQSVLLRRGQRSHSTLHETLYNVYEAKRYSQAVGSVGLETALSVVSANGKKELSSFKLDDQLEKLYTVYGPKDLPWDFQLDGPIYYSEEKAIEEAARAVDQESGQTTLNSLLTSLGTGDSEEAGSSVAPGIENPANVAE